MPKEGLEQAAPAAGTGRTGSELVDTVMLQGACSLPSFLVPFLFHLMKLYRGVVSSAAGGVGVAEPGVQESPAAREGGRGRGRRERVGWAGRWAPAARSRDPDAAAVPSGEQPGPGGREGASPCPKSSW